MNICPSYQRHSFHLENEGSEVLGVDILPQRYTVSEAKDLNLNIMACIRVLLNLKGRDRLGHLSVCWIVRNTLSSR